VKGLKREGLWGVTITEGATMHASSGGPPK